MQTFILVASFRAYSKVVLHVIRIDEARVRFSLGPQKQGVADDYVFVAPDGTTMRRMPQFLIAAPPRLK